MDADLRLRCEDTDTGRALWTSSEVAAPAVVVRNALGERRLPLTAAASRRTDACSGGWRLFFEQLPDSDAVLCLTLGLDSTSGDLSLEVEQRSGEDVVVEVEDLYSFDKPCGDGGYLVLPHGSGYLIPADCPAELPGSFPGQSLVGARWSLPFFGMVAGDGRGLCLVAETWWDCEVVVRHEPENQSSLRTHWRPSLGRLGYPRRLVVRAAAEGLDYLAMADGFRRSELASRRTLAEKAEDLPVLRRYLDRVLIRWPGYDPALADVAIDDLRTVLDKGFEVNYFFPKWSSTEGPPDGGWQAFLREDPVPGGWEALRHHADLARSMGCSIQGFINHRSQQEGAPGYAASRNPLSADGERDRSALSGRDARERLERVLDRLEQLALRFDAIYFDGLSAYDPLPQDFSPEQPTTNRENYEAQVACFRALRQRAILPGAEVARFWSAGECGFFFFTDWSRDRLTNVPTQNSPESVGVPVPLFQLVYSDCCASGFSGGGYREYAEGFDWWRTENPRLYELLYGAAPAHNWLPDGGVPVRVWDKDQHWEWLHLWSTWFRAIAMLPLTSHRFVDADHSRQIAEYGGAARIEVDFHSGRFRIEGVQGIDPRWMLPPSL